MKFAQYQTQILEDVQTVIQKFNCQPVLFVGSGLSKRYFGAPSWVELLQNCLDACPEFSRPYGYYSQEAKGDYLRVASMLVDGFSEWAWSGNSNNFPKDTLSEDFGRDYYLKKFVCDELDAITPMRIRDLDADIVSEIHKLREIRPHAVITTNYDQFLSRVYPDYERIVGREVLGSKSLAIGEIFQIHGSTSNPESLVLTTDDYVAFEKNKKFIAAKLLTLFSEHPLLIAGYSVADSNVKELFADIDLALGSPGELLENIYYLEFKKDVDRQTSFPSEKMIQVASNRSVRVKLIQAERFGWVYNAFKAPEFMEPVSPKILRAFMARAKQLTRVDIPRQKVQADFQMLAERVDSQENFVSLLGIASIDEATQLSALYPWNATELASQLGLSHWSKAYKLIDQIKAETGVDIRTFDNEYHRRQRYGKQRIPLYSPGCKALLQRVQSGEKITKEWLDIGI